MKIDEIIKELEEAAYNAESRYLSGSKVYTDDSPQILTAARILRACVAAGFVNEDGCWGRCQ